LIAGASVIDNDLMNLPEGDKAADADREGQEISLSSAAGLCRLGLGAMVDIRQNFEIELAGAIPGTLHIPLFEAKRMLGHQLTEDEPEILDAGKAGAIDVQGYFTAINQMHHVRDGMLRTICNSGRRSVSAARLLGSMGYGKALSVAVGLQAWKIDKPALTPLGGAG
jgi:rhodanese-related sulfurtransferase